MPYVPDATDDTEPTDGEKASSMGLEFRTLKTYIQTVILALVAAKAPLTGGGTSGNWAITAAHAGDTQNVVNGGQVISQAVYAAANPPTGKGYVRMLPGDTTHTGFIEFINPDTTRKGYIGFGGIGAGLPIRFDTDDGSVWETSTGVRAPNFYGALVGNADSASSIPWTGISSRPTKLSQFENDIGAGNGGGGAGVSSFNTRVGGIVLQNTDVNTALGFVPYNSSNPASYTTLAAVSSAGFQTSSGTVAHATDVTGASSNGFGTRTVSTVGPSGGSDGDIWIVVAS